jgi:hypothetical protein
MRGTRVAQTQRIDIYVGIHTFSEEQIVAAAPRIEQMLRDNEERFGTRLDHRVSLAFYRPAIALIEGIRGMAFTEEDRAEVYYHPDEDLERALSISSHELAHLLEAQRYGEDAQRRADTILHEGLATWISGERWLMLCNARTWKGRAQNMRAEGIPLRLLDAEIYGANNAYEMWASFVDYLIKEYGWEKVDALYVSGRGRAPGSSDYEGVLGKSLNEVAGEWRAWLDR